MKLVEDDQRCSLKPGIGLDAARQYPFGHDLDAGLIRDPRIKTDRVPHGLAGLLAEGLGHPAGSRHGSDPARFKHHDAALFGRQDVEQGQRHPGRLARTRRRVKHHSGMSAQRLFQRRQDRINGIGGHGLIITWTGGGRKAELIQSHLDLLRLRPSPLSSPHRGEGWERGDVPQCKNIHFVRICILNTADGTRIKSGTVSPVPSAAPWVNPLFTISSDLIRVQWFLFDRTAGRITAFLRCLAWPGTGAAQGPDCTRGRSCWRKCVP